MKRKREGYLSKWSGNLAIFSITIKDLTHYFYILFPKDINIYILYKPFQTNILCEKEVFSWFQEGKAKKHWLQKRSR